MRFIHLLFTVYLVTLSVYPCYDDRCGQDGARACATEHHDDEGDDDKPDACTPFCASRCCVLHVTLPIKPALQPHTVTQDCNTTYRISATPFVILPIWQPPKA